MRTKPLNLKTMTLISSRNHPAFYFQDILSKSNDTSWEGIVFCHIRNIDDSTLSRKIANSCHNISKTLPSLTIIPTWIKPNIGMWSRYRKEKDDKDIKEDEKVLTDESEKKEDPAEKCDNSPFSNFIEKKRRSMVEMTRKMLLLKLCLRILLL